MRLIAGLLLWLPLTLQAQDHSHHDMQVGRDGVVMNENTDTLPRGCAEISEDLEFTIHAGRKYANHSGMTFGMSEHEVAVTPCSRVSVTLINEDEVRHQWMVHGLPKYLYPAGMFHIEAMGGQSMQGTFIVPPESRTYLIHCDMAQHMEKGMRGQLLVGGGNGDLWGVPGISSDFFRADYLASNTVSLVLLASLLGFFATLAFVLRK